jgi:hypothetical protein
LRAQAAVEHLFLLAVAVAVAVAVGDCQVHRR